LVGFAASSRTLRQALLFIYKLVVAHQKSMNKNLLIVLLLFSTRILFSQKDTTDISFIAYWSLNDQYEFNISKINRRWENDTLTKNDSIKYKAIFKIIDSTASSYNVSWSFGNYVKNSLNKSISDLMPDKNLINEVSSKYDLSNIVYKTDEFGELIEIIDWQKFSSALSEYIDDVIRKSKLKYPNKADEIEKALAVYLNLYRSKAGIEYLIMTELQYFHFPLGMTLKTNEEFKYEQELPSITGGEPLRAEAILSFPEIDYSELYCVLKEEAKINEADAKNAVLELLIKMGLNEEQVKNTIDKSIFDIRDLNYYQYYYDPGIPHRIYGSRTYELKMPNQDFTEIKEVIIELIYN
jgi:hypothetical protein